MSRGISVLFSQSSSIKHVLFFEVALSFKAIKSCIGIVFFLQSTDVRSQPQPKCPEYFSPPCTFWDAIVFSFRSKKRLQRQKSNYTVEAINWPINYPSSVNESGENQKILSDWIISHFAELKEGWKNNLNYKTKIDWKEIKTIWRIRTELQIISLALERETV